MVENRLLAASPVRQPVAAVSVGLVEGVPLLDLDYSEDSRADVDLNVAALEDGGIVEVQGTAEGSPFVRQQMNQMLDRAMSGIQRLIELQRKAIALNDDERTNEQ